MTKCITIISTIIVTFCVSDCCFSEQLNQSLENINITTNNINNNVVLRRSNALILTEEEENEIDNILAEMKNEEERFTKMIKAAIKFFDLIEINVNNIKRMINKFLGSDNTKDFIQCLEGYKSVLEFIVNQLKVIQGNYSKENLKNINDLLEAYKTYLENINNLFKTNNGVNLLNNIRNEDKQKVQNKLYASYLPFEAFLESFINSASNKKIKV